MTQMITRRILKLLLFVPLYFWGAPVSGLEPQISFTQKNQWIRFHLSQDSKPLPDAQLNVLLLGGHKYAETESDSLGEGEFPVPKDEIFRIEIKIGERVCDPIQLTRIDQDVVPNRVLLSFGLQPCCRVATGEQTPIDLEKTNSTESFFRNWPTWLRFVGGMVFALIGLIVLFYKRQ